MASGSVLYYPFMSVPNGDWTKQALMFNKKIGIITPQHFDEHQGDTAELQRLEVLEEINPTQLSIDSSFEDKFISHLEKGLSEKKFSPTFDKLFSIYGGKFLGKIEQFFKENKLIKEHDSNQYYIDRNLGSLYIASLAHEIVKMPTYSEFKLYSDSKDSIASISLHMKKQVALYSALQAPIPVPQKATLEEILRFREDNEMYLSNYIKKINQEIRRLTQKNQVSRDELNLVVNKLVEESMNFEEQALKIFGRKNILRTALAITVIGLDTSNLGLGEVAKGIGATLGLFINELSSELASEKKENPFYYISRAKKFAYV